MPYSRCLTYCLTACQTFCLLLQKSSGKRPPRRRRHALSLPVVRSPRGEVLPLGLPPAVPRSWRSVLQAVVAPQGEYLSSRPSDWSDPGHSQSAPSIARLSCKKLPPQKVAAKSCHQQGVARRPIAAGKERSSAASGPAAISDPESACTGDGPRTLLSEMGTANTE